jgi:uncharacterized protein YwgA
MLLFHLKSVPRSTVHDIVYVTKKCLGFGYDFIYGPYSPTLQRDLDMLCAIGVLKVKTVVREDGYLYFYEITEKCEQIMQRYYIGGEHSEKIRQTVSKLSKLDAGVVSLLAKRLFTLES